jgi:NADH-quinone oxidoreductase subunit L
MNLLLQLFIVLPLLGFVISLLIHRKYESAISWTAFSTVLLQLLGFLVFVVFWIIDGANDLNLKEVTVIKTDGYEFFIDFYFDKVTAVYMFIGALLTFMVTTYSRYYLHRESGYKRFFNTVLFFFIGYNIAVLAGNFETLFLGWEILGITSFLLIAFYRDRYLPVKNAVKVFSIYRIGDIGIILAMWASHHLWHENITFMKLNNYQLVHEHLSSHTMIGAFISLVIVIAAAAKSAQLPFSSWLPRAMEGPTPSSAIFYGSLSVHLGVFLLLRTFPFWEHQTSIRILIGILGIVTSVVASLTARSQSSVKSQVAYASISQIGLIFVEVAAGFENMALIHFAGNAFLRTYQLLVSPSVVSYMIREQFYNYVPKTQTIEDSLPKRLEYSLYMMSLKEFKLEAFMNLVFWKPLKRIGSLLDFLNLKSLYFLFIPLYVLGILSYQFQDAIPYQIRGYFPAVFAFIGMIMVFKSFSERKSPFVAWVLIIMNHFWIALSIFFNEKVEFNEIVLYLSGIVVAGFVGYFSLHKLMKQENGISLNQFSGHSYEHPRFALLFLVAALGVTGFPITSTFVGEDLLYSHIHSNQIILAIFVSQSFIIGGIAAIRIYARIYLGPHCKSYHELPYKSS